MRKSVIFSWVQGRNPGRLQGGRGVQRGLGGESKIPPIPLASAERVPFSRQAETNAVVMLSLTIVEAMKKTLGTPSPGPAIGTRGDFARAAGASATCGRGQRPFPFFAIAVAKRTVSAFRLRVDALRWA